MLAAPSTLLLQFVSGAPVHHCVHDQLSHHPPTLSRQRLHVRGREARLSSPTPLRIIFSTETLSGDELTCYSSGQVVRVGNPSGSSRPACSDSVKKNCYLTCTDDHILDAAREDWLVNRLLPAVAAWFGAALRIKQRVVGPLMADPGSRCGFEGDIQIPENFVKLGCALPWLRVLWMAGIRTHERD